jgi:hypothetical protein
MLTAMAMSIGTGSTQVQQEDLDRLIQTSTECVERARSNMNRLRRSAARLLGPMPAIPGESPCEPITGALAILQRLVFDLGGINDEVAECLAQLEKAGISQSD